LQAARLARQQEEELSQSGFGLRLLAEESREDDESFSDSLVHAYAAHGHAAMGNGHQSKLSESASLIHPPEEVLPRGQSGSTSPNQVTQPNQKPPHAQPVEDLTPAGEASEPSLHQLNPAMAIGSDAS